MKEQFVDIETAKLAKEKGFDWECPYTFHAPLPNIMPDLNKGLNLNPIKIPTQSLLQKWLRDEKGASVLVVNYYSDYTCVIKRLPDGHRNGYNMNVLESTYEQALEQGLIEALKLI